MATSSSSLRYDFKAKIKSRDRAKTKCTISFFGHSFAMLVALILLPVLAFKFLDKKKNNVFRNADVFLSFCGSDTQKSFTDHLYHGLVDAGIHTFRVIEERYQSEEINQATLAAITDSKIMIPIISLNYGSNRRCLDELVQIIECKENNTGQIVLLIFYKVEPTHVRHQIGKFGEEFRKHFIPSYTPDEKFHRRIWNAFRVNLLWGSWRCVDPSILKKWMQALNKVSSFKGWEADRNEGELARSIVRNALSKLKSEFELGVPKDLVRIDHHVEKVIKFVDNDATLFVGIYGMRGIDKTFLDKTIYNRVFDQFECSSFIPNISESCKHDGLEHLQSRLISDLVKLGIEIHNKDEGIRLLSSRFTRKKVLIILDDVDDTDQLKALAANRNWFSPGSRILITTRNNTILDNALVDYKYELKEMDKEDQSLILSSSSTALTRKNFDYEVLLSFRGKDTREGFTDHLYIALGNAGIHAFRDNDNLRQGEEIGPYIFDAIKSSKILIPILSENYGSSKWCLDELACMLECNNNSSGQRVFPIFYKVNPGDVKYQEKSFGDVFHAYTKHPDPEIVKKWKQALKEVTIIKGWLVESNEGDLVKSVVRKVFYELTNGMELMVSDYLVGIDSHVEKVMECVNKRSNAALLVGIHGMGGIGKTTLGKVIYNKLLDQFERHSFIADIRESCKRKHKGIVYLQNQLIFDLARLDIGLRDYEDGINIVKRLVKTRKVLILLDDVNEIDQLKALADPHWFAPGSIILVTTRNESVLDRAGVDIKYEHKEMQEEQSLILFSKHTFQKDSPPSDFLALSRTVLSIIGGFPLAIEDVGSSLCRKNPSQWRDTIQKMQENVLPVKVRKSLRTSYDELECAERQIFLDIACFLIGSDVRVALYMWHACDLMGMMGIEALRSLSMINVGDNHELKMHNQMRDLGREIVHQESCHEPHKRSRLWDYEEALEVIVGNKGTANIEAICLEKGNSTRIADEDDSDYKKDKGGLTFTDKEFRSLPNLRFLRMSDVKLTGDFSDLFSRLRWLKWGNCPSNFAATKFHARELVILDLSRSSISDVWQGWHSMMKAEKLKVLNLTSCHSLKRTPDLSSFKRLEILILRDCSKLEQIDNCIGDVENLVSLDLSGCSRLKKLSLQMVKLEQLEELLLDETAMQEIPSSISSLRRLRTLSARDCKSLIGLPDSIGSLVYLSTLVLSGCVELATLPHSIGFLKNLRCLSLGSCQQLREIPSWIGNLKLLTQLDLSGCSRIQQLPPQIGELKQLEKLLLDETAIQEIPSFINSLEKLEMRSANNCKLTL